jgi:hypothetical protein
MNDLSSPPYDPKTYRNLLQALNRRPRNHRDLHRAEGADDEEKCIGLVDAVCREGGV